VLKTLLVAIFNVLMVLEIQISQRVENEAHEVRPATVVHDMKIELVDGFIQSQRRISARELASKFNISGGCVYTKLRKVTAR
jgi:ribosomal protein S25